MDEGCGSVNFYNENALQSDEENIASKISLDSVESVEKLTDQKMNYYEDTVRPHLISHSSVLSSP